MEQKWLRGAREGNRLEAKLAKGGVPSSVWETYSAFANTEGGTIVLGATEASTGELEIVGLPDAEGLLKKLWDGVNNPSKVSANLLSNADIFIEEEDGKRYLRICVPRASRQLRPVYVAGNQARGTYRRNGEGDYHCSTEEIAAMVRDASMSPLDALVLPEFDLEALNRDSVNRFRSVMEAVRPNHPWLQLGFEEFLIRLNAAGRIGGEGRIRPTRAGLLMFGYEFEIVREYPEYFLDYREMGGRTRWRDRLVSNDGTWGGGVFDFWSLVLPRLSAGIKRPFELDESLRRVEDTDMHAAVREVLVNSLVHSDYYGRRGVVVRRFADKIEIENPGSLRIALDVMVAGGVSDARNPTLMKMFGLINACEKAGSGFDVMRRAAIEAQALPPLAEECFGPDRVTVTMYLGSTAAENGVPLSTPGEEGPTEAAIRSKTHVVGLFSTQGGLGDFTKDERVVLQMARAEKQFSRKDVEKLLSCGPTKAKSIVSALLQKNVIVSKGAGRSIRYSVIEVL